jgi:hypothetical protein
MDPDPLVDGTPYLFMGLIGVPSGIRAPVLRRGRLGAVTGPSAPALLRLAVLALVAGIAIPGGVLLSAGGVLAPVQA